MRTRRILLGIAMGVAGGLAAFTVAAHAATLSVSPTSGTYSSGQTVTVSINVSSAGSAVNAVSGLLVFPAGTMSVTGVSRGSSIVSTWVQEPAYSNANGTVEFEGVIFNPGFTGSRGNVLNVTFRFKAAGTANLQVTNGSVLANDGQGTELLSGTNGASYTVGAAAPEVVPPPAPTPEPADAPVAGSPTSITDLLSPTHPVEGQWYGGSTAQFAWHNPAGTNAVYYDLLSRGTPLSADARNPAQQARFNIENFTDGVYVFQVRARTDKGKTDIARRTVRIDRTAPSITNFMEEKRGDSGQPTPTFTWDAVTDAASGVARLEISTDGTTWSPLSPDATSVTLPPQPPGTHGATLRAVDYAGNIETAQTQFAIKAFPTPVVENALYLQKGNVSRPNSDGPTAIVSGTAVPNARILIELSHEGEKENVTGIADERGSWAVAYHATLASGDWHVRAQAMDEGGSQSQWTLPYTLSVPGSWDTLVHFGYLFLTALGILVGIAALAALGYFMVHFGAIMHRRAGRRGSWRNKK